MSSLLVISATHSHLVVAEDRSVVESVVSEMQARDAFSCSSDRQRVVEFKSGQLVYSFELPSLFSTPIIHPFISCRRFLAEWLDSKFSDSARFLAIQFSRSQSSAAEREIWQLDQPNIREDCVKLGFCGRGALEKINLREELKSCQPESDFASLISRVMPRFLRRDVNPIPNVRVATFPIRHLSEELQSSPIASSSDAVFASTMTVGRSALKRLGMGATPGHPVFVALDASLLVQDRAVESALKATEQAPGLYLNPITSGGFFRTIHHWKIAIGDRGPYSAISGMNLSNIQSVSYGDFVYQFQDSVVTNELRELVYWSYQAQCRKVGDLNCLLRFAGEKDAVVNRTADMVKEGCKQFRDRYEAPYFEPTSHYFMQPQNTDLTYVVKSLIQSAKSEVVILSHKFSLQELYVELLAAQARGVRVSVYLANSPQIRADKQLASGGIFFFPLGSAALEPFPDPHMKSLVVDRETLFFGTGGFTKNAFFDARELFGVTHDRHAIEEVLEYAESLRFFYQRDFSHPHSDSPMDKSWVVLPTDSAVVAQDAQLALYTALPSQPWMHAQYREVGPNGQLQLQRCGLGSIKFISYRDFKQCVG